MPTLLTNALILTTSSNFDTLPLITNLVMILFKHVLMDIHCEKISKEHVFFSIEKLYRVEIRTPDCYMFYSFC